MRITFANSSVAIICAAALVLLTMPSTFARTHTRPARIHRHGEYYRDYSGYLDPRSGHYDPEFERNRENFGFSGRDPSRVGGEDPNLHPSGPL